MLKPRVFIPYEPLRVESGTPRRYMDLRPAERYGKLHFVLPAKPYTEPAKVIPALRRGYASLTANDYVVLLGDPTIMVWAGIAAVNACPFARLLNWDPDAHDYTVMSLNIP